MRSLFIQYSFKPLVLMSTKSAIDLQHVYLFEDNFIFVMLERLTQDALENCFSTIRSRQLKPNTHLFRVSLRLLCNHNFKIIIKN